MNPAHSPDAATKAAELSIGHILDLSTAADRDELIRASADLPNLHRLAQHCIDDYLRWFAAPEWRKVYSGGMVGGPSPRGGHAGAGSTIEHVLGIVEKLRRLEQSEGFDRAVSGLNNPSQVTAVMFEVAAADWCAARAVHQRIEFSPAVQTRTGTKYPDFAWWTELGRLYCECKQVNDLERREARRLGVMRDVAAGAMGDIETWPRAWRVDVEIDGNLGRNPDARIDALVARMADSIRRGETPSMLQDGAITVVARLRSDEPVAWPGSRRASMMRLESNKATRIGAENAYVTVTRSYLASRAKVVSDVVRDAKKQLPGDAPGAVFIDMPGATEATARLRAMLTQPAHDRIVWASVWTAHVPRSAVWREAQPFDGRLLSGPDVG